VQLVDAVVVVADLLREADVLRREQLGELLRDGDVEAAELLERRAQRLRHDLLGEAVPGELGDVLGHVAHALERRADAQGADHDAEVAGDGVLAGQDVDGELVEGDRALVDAVVVGDDLLRQRHVGVVEGRGGVLDRDGDEARDLDEALLHLLQFLLEYLAHGSLGLSSFRGCPGLGATAPCCAGGAARTVPSTLTGGG
jgi:hypothetical protein